MHSTVKKLITALNKLSDQSHYADSSCFRSTIADGGGSVKSIFTYSYVQLKLSTRE